MPGHYQQYIIEVVNLFFLFILCGVGFFAVYQDVKTGKVKNSLILTGLLAGALCYLSLAAGGGFSSGAGFIYLKKVLLNVLISWIASFFIWRVGLWSAGDAKVFMLFSFLLPLRYYSNNLTLPFFPSFILLVNSFILVMIFILFEALLMLGRTSIGFILAPKAHREDMIRFFCRLKDNFKEINRNKSGYFKTGLVYLCILILFYILRTYVKLETTRAFSPVGNIVYPVIFFMFLPLKRLLAKINTGAACFIFCFLCIYVLFMSALPGAAQPSGLGIVFRDFIGFTLVLSVFFCFLELYIKRKDQITLSPEKISPYILLSKESLEKVGEELKREGIKEKFYADGLTPAQAEYIKNLTSKNPDFNKISIYKTFPFVPFIFSGTIITFMTKGAILDLRLVVSIFKT